MRNSSRLIIQHSRGTQYNSRVGHRPLIGLGVEIVGQWDGIRVLRHAEWRSALLLLRTSPCLIVQYSLRAVESPTGATVTYWIWCRNAPQQH